jgi:tetratricopeptide (TPR) repeat protein/predicted Ser/Thr protein kinase
VPFDKDLHAGQLALARGVYEEAERFFLQAAKVAENFGPGDTAWADVQKGLARVYLAQGKAEKAEACAKAAFEADQLFYGLECEQVADDCVLLGEAFRKQWDFERARPWFERAAQFREQNFGTTHNTTLEAYSRLLIVYLQSQQQFGLEQIHAKVYEAYQTRHPSGMWATFLQLFELGKEYVAANRVQDFQSLLRTEVALLRKQVGNNHKEVATVLAVEADLLKKSNRSLAAWSVGSRAQTVEKANNLSLFAADERTYKLPANQVDDAIAKLLSAGNWHVQPKLNLTDPLNAALRYEDGEGRAELKLTMQVAPRGPFCTVTFQWQLLRSSRMQLAKALISMTLKDLDDNISVMPALNLPAGFASASGSFGGVGAIGAGAAPSAQSGWPTPQQFNEAVQNPSSAFVDAELKSAEPEMNAIGLPKPYSGAFATVYKLSAGGGNVAIKCFTTKVPDQQMRYAAISDQLNSTRLQYFADFEYKPEGIKIGGNQFPLLKMDWVEGQSLPVYIQTNLGDSKKIETLAVRILEMVAAMQSHGIAHGDLQHGNIMILNDAVRLVDYDGMYVKALQGSKSNELGHRNYQHPRRKPEHFDERLDNFSTWVIYASLMCLSRAPQMWELLQAGDEALLFKQADFANPDNSHALRLLLGEADPVVKATVRAFNEVVRMPPEDIPFVTEALTV